MVRIFSFGERWNVLFNSAIASLNRTFHLSPHENILTTALINIHYLYTIGHHVTKINQFNDLNFARYYINRIKYRLCATSIAPFARGSWRTFKFALHSPFVLFSVSEVGVRLVIDLCISRFCEFSSAVHQSCYC